MELEIGIEPLSVPDFLRLAELQWGETETYQVAPMAPLMDRYVEYNRTGYYLWYVVRHGAKIVGHAGMYLDESMHTGVKIASEDTWYIEKAYRGGGLGSALLRYIEDDMTARGVGEVHLTVKETNPAVAGMVLGHGYQKVATEYMKALSNVQAKGSKAA